MSNFQSSLATGTFQPQCARPSAVLAALQKDGIELFKDSISIMYIIASINIVLGAHDRDSVVLYSSSYEGTL